jgi:hypothetical protein
LVVDERLSLASKLSVHEHDLRLAVGHGPAQAFERRAPERFERLVVLGHTE